MINFLENMEREFLETTCFIVDNSIDGANAVNMEVALGYALILKWWGIHDINKNYYYMDSDLISITDKELRYYNEDEEVDITEKKAFFIEILLNCGHKTDIPRFLIDSFFCNLDEI